MMALTCSESFLSISAMIAWIVLIASSLTTAADANACSASVCTPCLMASAALSVLGLNAPVMSLSNSLISIAPPAAAAASFAASAMLLLLLAAGWCCWRRRCAQRLEQWLVLQHIRQQILGLSLPI